MDLQDHTVTQFTQEELLLIAAKLGLERTELFEAHVLVDQIRIALIENGAPVDNLVDEFINTIRLFEEVIQVEVEEFSIPTCFGHTNDSDPNCSYCLLYLQCGERLVNEKLPDCFGQLYDQLQCVNCMVKTYCKTSLPKSEDIAQSYECYLFNDEYFVGNILHFLGRYRSVRYDWPSEIVKHKLARFNRFRIKSASIKEVPSGVLKDAIYFRGGKGIKATERMPLVFHEERNGLYRDNLFQSRLVWKLSGKNET